MVAPGRVELPTFGLGNRGHQSFLSWLINLRVGLSSGKWTRSPQTAVTWQRIWQRLRGRARDRFKSSRFSAVFRYPCSASQILPKALSDAEIDVWFARVAVRVASEGVFEAFSGSMSEWRYFAMLTEDSYCPGTSD